MFVYFDAFPQKTDIDLHESQGLQVSYEYGYRIHMGESQHCPVLYEDRDRFPIAAC